MSQARDQIFLQIVGEMVDLITETTAKCSQEVLHLSSTFVDERCHKTLENFYSLYFPKKGAQDDSKVVMNKEVDRLFEEAKASLEETGEVTLETTEAEEQRRLGLSAVQKELEALITVEKNVREQLHPVLSSMQFEDAVRQRLEHITFGWDEIIAKRCDEAAIDVDALRDCLSSVEETKLFYEEVLKEPPPEDDGSAGSGSSMLFF